MGRGIATSTGSSLLSGRRRLREPARRQLSTAPSWHLSPTAARLGVENGEWCSIGTNGYGKISGVPGSWLAVGEMDESWPLANEKRIKWTHPSWRAISERLLPDLEQTLRDYTATGRPYYMPCTVSARVRSAGERGELPMRDLRNIDGRNRVVNADHLEAVMQVTGLHDREYAFLYSINTRSLVLVAGSGEQLRFAGELQVPHEDTYFPS